MSESLRARSSGLAVAVENLSSGKEIINTADQALSSIQDILRSMRRLSLRSANEAITDEDRSHIQAEMDALVSEIDRISSTTEYNSMTLLDGSLGLTATPFASDAEAFSHIKVTDKAALDGDYTVRVLRDADQGKAALIGKVFSATEVIPDLDGSISSLIGSDNPGEVVIRASYGDQSVNVLVDSVKDSIREVMDKLQEAFKSIGNDVSVEYIKPAGPQVSVTWDVSNVISEPIDSTVPVVWDTSPWTDNTVGDTRVTLAFTSATTYTVTGNVTGNNGTFNLGDNVDTKGLHFNLAPDADPTHTYAAGDTIELNIKIATRIANILTSNTGLTSSQVISGYNSISDGLHTVTANTNPYQILALNTGGVIGEKPAGNFDAGPAVTDAIPNTSVVITMTGNNTFSVAGNVSGAMGGGTTGNPFVSPDGSLSFQLSPDALYIPGDKVTLSITKRVDATLTGGSISGNLPISLIDGFNDSLDLTIDGVNSTVDLSAGLDTYATGGALAAALQNAINTDAIFAGAGKSVTVSYSAGALKIVNDTQGAAGSLAIQSAGLTDAAPTLKLVVGSNATGAAATYDGKSVTGPGPGVQNLSVSALAVNTLRTESFTMTLSTDNDGADVWSVVGSISGAHGNYVSGTAGYVTNSTAIGGGGVSIYFDPNIRHKAGDKITFVTRNDGTIALDADSTPTATTASSSANLYDDSLTSALRVSVGNDFKSGSDTIQVVTTSPSSVLSTVYDKPAPVISFPVSPHLLPSNDLDQDQTYTLTLIDDKDGADVWSVVGSVSGNHNNYVAGSNYVSDSGSLGHGGGLNFRLSQSVRYQVGSQIFIGVNSDRPRIEVTSDHDGSGEGINLELISDSSNGITVAVGSEGFTIGEKTATISSSTIVAGLGTNPFDNLGISPGNFFIEDKSGAVHTVTVNAGDRISDVLNSIMAAAPTMNATWDQDSGAILISDTSVGPETFKVFDAPGSFIAEDLEITGESAGVLWGRNITRTRDYILEVTGPDGSVGTVRASASGGTSVIDPGTGKIIAVKDNVNDTIGERGGVYGIEIALNEDEVFEGSILKFSVSRGTLSVQGGPSSGSDDRLLAAVGSLSALDLGVAGIDVSSGDSARRLIDSGAIDAAIEKVSLLRGSLGAFSNRIDHTSLSTRVYKLNLDSSESRIRDADTAQEMMNLLKEQILEKTRTSMLSRISQSKQGLIDALLA